MAERPPRILQVGTADIFGGAERVAWDLFQGYRARGLVSWLAVGRKLTHDPHVVVVPNDAYGSGWARLWMAMGNMPWPLVGRMRGARRLRHWLHLVGRPSRLLRILRGYEDFDFPGTWRLWGLTAEPPDVVHCHNLHGGYFDLRVMPWLSRQLPVVLTLHDTWLLGGHCTYSLDCQRWRTGCGHCPDLTIPQAIRRDATATNWRRKQGIYAQSRLYVATPSRWLMQKVEQSMLAPAVVESRVIPNGVDLRSFHPAGGGTARAALGIPQDTRVLLFAAKHPRRNVWKDYQTVRAAAALVAERLHGQRVLFIVLGEDAPSERVGQAEVRFVPFQNSPEAVARYYQAADVYVHAARADNFPNVVLEALACGTPVVATAVGGIPEQVRGLRAADVELRGGDGELNGHSAHEATGVLVPPIDAEAMAAAVVMLLADDDLRMRLGRNATEDAQRRFNLDHQVEDYLGWYGEIVEDWRARQVRS